MKIRFLLSAKRDNADNQQILLFVQPYINGKLISMRAKSGIFIKEKHFDKECGIKYNMNAKEAVYHREQKQKLDQLTEYIKAKLCCAAPGDFNCTWLKDNVDVYYNRSAVRKDKPTFFELIEPYIEDDDKGFSFITKSGKRVTFRVLKRYTEFVRLFEGRQDFTFDYDQVSADDIEGFRDYLRNETSLIAEYPKIFKEIAAKVGDKSFLKRVDYNIGRGVNCIITKMKHVKAYFAWLREKGYTTNNPFEGVKIGAEKYGTPYYISIVERKQIATAEMPTDSLSVQRDIFVFQCFVGCRVGDLMTFTNDFIKNGMLEYTPHKTKDKGSQSKQVRVPLTAEAIAILDKYKNVDKDGRVLPFISPQKYNQAIKEVFKAAGVTRMVEVRHPISGEIEKRPINEIASSHLARRTFVGNLYFKVQDPNIIGAMSGHAEGSRAFSRYRKIEDDTLKSVVDLLN